MDINSPGWPTYVSTIGAFQLAVPPAPSQATLHFICFCQSNHTEPRLNRLLPEQGQNESGLVYQAARCLSDPLLTLNDRLFRELTYVCAGDQRGRQIEKSFCSFLLNLCGWLWV